MTAPALACEDLELTLLRALRDIRSGARPALSEATVVEARAFCAALPPPMQRAARTSLDDFGLLLDLGCGDEECKDCWVRVVVGPRGQIRIDDGVIATPTEGQELAPVAEAVRLATLPYRKVHGARPKRTASR